MFKAGKIWGETELILANNACEFHRIDFKKGGVCSKHLHEWKWNGFYCMSGQLKIKSMAKGLRPSRRNNFKPRRFYCCKTRTVSQF